MSGRAVSPAGSPAAGEPAFLAVGKIRRPHGVNGDVLVEIYTDFPERLLPKMILYVGENHQAVTVARRREHKDGLLLAFEKYSTPEAVGVFRNQILYSDRKDSPKLAKGEFYQYELLGLIVSDESGSELGTLSEVIETGANDVYVVTDKTGRELLLPAIQDVVLEIDLELKTMRVHLLPGLLEDED
jgi:16S rRNA processing protein RimM